MADAWSSRGRSRSDRFAVCGRWRERLQKNVVVGVIAYKRRGPAAVSAVTTAPAVTWASSPPSPSVMVGATRTEECVATNGTIMPMLIRAGASRLTGRPIC